jgi:predicted AlkP superfamily pyrophosphatase or phosphodiesterase
MGKVILILIDALRDDTARQSMGYLEHLVKYERATRWSCRGEMPTMSRPMYETIHTGVPPYVHGITSNAIVRRSIMPNVFEQARQHGKVTAASAYAWFSELYNRVPYDISADKEVDDDALAIQHGRYYSHDDMPDSEVFAAGGALIRRFMPDYLLIHPMQTDTIGERYGGDSPEYRRNVTAQDVMIATLHPMVTALGYTVIVTGDHGMSDDPSQHGGSTPEQRNVPLYLLPPDGRGRGDLGVTVSQLQLAPTLLALLGVPIPSTMQAQPIHEAIGEHVP